MKTLKYITCLTICGLLVLACSKDGDQGPIGPQGQQGTQGEAGLAGVDGQDGEDGTQGPQGEQGEPGTANVIYSEWFTADFGETPIVDTQVTFSIKIIEGLTDEIRNSGLIMVYARRVGGLDAYAISSLPVTVYTPVNQHYYFEHWFTPSSNRIDITILSIDETGIGTPAYSEFRYVLVPGGIPISDKTTSIDYAKMSYEVICEHLNIPE